MGTSPTRPSFATSELYFIRSYAGDQQERIAGPADPDAQPDDVDLEEAVVRRMH